MADAEQWLGAMPDIVSRTLEILEADQPAAVRLLMAVAADALDVASTMGDPDAPDALAAVLAAETGPDSRIYAPRGWGGYGQAPGSSRLRQLRRYMAAIAVDWPDIERAATPDLGYNLAYLAALASWAAVDALRNGAPADARRVREAAIQLDAVCEGSQV